MGRFRVAPDGIRTTVSSPALAGKHPVALIPSHAPVSARQRQPGNANPHQSISQHREDDLPKVAVTSPSCQ